MIEEDAGAREHAVRLTVLLHDPEPVLLGDCVRGIRMERSHLVLRHLLDLAVELAGRGLIDAAGLGESAQTHRLEDAQHTGRVDVGGELGRVERHLHVTLRSEVVDLVRLHLRDDLEDRARIAEIAVVKMEVRSAF